MTTDAPQEKGSAFEWWMIANIAIGAGFSAFVALLIPPYVSEATGNAAAAGIVMAIISLAAVLGPVLGGLADKYRAHRLIMNLGVLGMAVAFAMYALSAETNSLFAIDAIVMGASIAAVSAVAPVFVVGARLPKKLEAKRLTTYNLVAPVGQVLGGACWGRGGDSRLVLHAAFLAGRRSDAGCVYCHLADLEETGRAHCTGHGRG